jgi:hypothetical protein
MSDTATLAPGTRLGPYEIEVLAGKWLTCAADSSGHFEIFVQPFPKAQGRQQVSTIGGHHARWRADEK